MHSFGVLTKNKILYSWEIKLLILNFYFFMIQFHQKRKKKELLPDQKLEIKEAFELFDTDKDGALDYHELKVSFY